MLAALPRLAIRRPGVVLTVALAAVAVALPGLLRLELATDGRALAPASAPLVLSDAAVRAEHGVGDPLVVVLRARGRTDGAEAPADAVLAPPALRVVHDLTALLRQLPGVDESAVVSLATEPGLRPALRFDAPRPTLLEPFPDSASGTERVRGELASPILAAIYDGVLIADRGRATALFVDTPDDADRHAFVRRVEAAAHRALRSAMAGDPGLRLSVDVVGAPAAEALLGRHILRDLGVPAAWSGTTDTDLDAPTTSAVDSAGPPLVPLALGTMALVFLIAFRRPTAALLPLAEAGLALVLVFGAMGYLGVPIYLTTTVLPVVLTAVGVADEIHIFRRFERLARAELAGGSGGPALPASTLLAARTLDQLLRPIGRTSLTTAGGFLSFALSPLAPVRSFGLAAAAGVGVCFLISLTVVPALLAHLPLGWWVDVDRARRTRRATGEPEETTEHPGPFWHWLATFAARRREPILATVAGVALAAGIGALALRVQDSWEDGFAPDSRFARAARAFDRDFLGAHQLLVSVRAPAVDQRGTVGSAQIEDRRAVLPREAAGGLAPEQLVGAELELVAAASADRDERLWTGWIESAEITDDPEDTESGDAGLALTWDRREGSPRFWLLRLPVTVGVDAGGASGPPSPPRLDFRLTLRPLLVPETVDRVAAVEAELERHPAVGGVLGPALYLTTTARMSGSEGIELASIVDRPSDLRSLWGRYRRVRGEDRVRRLTDPDRFDRALITAYLKDANYADTARLLDDLDDFAARELEPAGLEVALAGDVAVSQALIRAVVTTQVLSLLLSLGVVFLLTAFYGRSWRVGLLCLTPPALAVLVDLGLLGGLGIPLGVATSMFAGMVLGVGVDGPIHLLERLRAEPGPGSPERIGRALADVGPAVALDAVALCLGFGVLLTSQVPATARLGGLLVASVATCLVGTLLVIPALVARQPVSPTAPNGAPPATESGSAL